MEKMLLKKYMVTLEPELAEWAKSQEGGMSLLIRQLLRQKRELAQPTATQDTRTGYAADGDG